MDEQNAKELFMLLCEKQSTQKALAIEIKAIKSKLTEARSQGMIGDKIEMHGWSGTWQQGKSSWEFPQSIKDAMDAIADKMDEAKLLGEATESKGAFHWVIRETSKNARATTQ